MLEDWYLFLTEKTHAFPKRNQIKRNNPIKHKVMKRKIGSWNIIRLACLNLKKNKIIFKKTWKYVKKSFYLVCIIIFAIIRIKQFIVPKIPKTINHIGIFWSIGQSFRCFIPIIRQDIGTPMNKMSKIVNIPKIIWNSIAVLYFNLNIRTY